MLFLFNSCFFPLRLKQTIENHVHHLSSSFSFTASALALRQLIHHQALLTNAHVLCQMCSGSRLSCHFGSKVRKPHLAHGSTLFALTHKPSFMRDHKLQCSGWELERAHPGMSLALVSSKNHPFIHTIEPHRTILGNSHFLCFYPNSYLYLWLENKLHYTHEQQYINIISTTYTPRFLCSFSLSIFPFRYVCMCVYDYDMCCMSVRVHDKCVLCCYALREFY